MKNVIIASAIAAYLLIPSPSQAGGHSVDKFMLADKDKNGTVSKAEFNAKYQEKFNLMDSNSDGAVSPDEYQSYMSLKYSQYQKEKFNKMDTNGDGAISPEEMSKTMKDWKHKH